jgi:exodeoxyribonuclease VII large subunit
MPPPPPDNAFEEPGAGWRPAGPPPTPAAGGRDVYSVSRLVNAARVALERGLGTLWVEGEVSNLARPASGHLYFTLKDGQSQVRCAMFRQRALLVRTPPRDGQQVLLRARVTMYEPRGEFQLVVDSLEDAGEGLLRRRFDELKGRLAGEGLFDAERKRPLPALPRTIGVVTSPSGAAIRDILHVLSRRFPAVPVVIYPTLVQGAGSVAQIVAALQAASRRREVDVLIVARGGGSLEDLWSFNEEAVARAIAACPMPVVSGVGHETDVTIADFVADMRAPTPSAAAELVVPDAAAWLRRARQSGVRLQQGAQRLVARARERARWLEARLAQAGPAARLEALAQRLDDLDRRLAAAARARVARPVGRLAAAERRLALASPLRRLSRLREQQAALARRLAAAGPRTAVAARQRLALAARTLQAVSPLATLGRGYALVTAADGRLVTSAKQVSPGTLIDVRLADGSFRAIVDQAVQDSAPPGSPPPVRE